MSNSPSSNLALIVTVVMTITFLYFMIYFANAHFTSNNDYADSKLARIKPIGQINIAKTDDVSTQTTAENKPKIIRSTKQIYDTFCAVCHTTGVAGAPKYADKVGWASRLTTDIEVLTTSVIKGKGAMPAKGTCFDCSDDEFKNVVNYMLEALN